MQYYIVKYTFPGEKDRKSIQVVAENLLHAERVAKKQINKPIEVHSISSTDARRLGI